MEQTNTWNSLDFRKYLSPAMLDMDETTRSRWLLENRVRTYNSLPGAEDGSGIRCPICKDRGTVAWIPEGELRMEVRPCECAPRRRTALRLRQCGMLERSVECTLARFRTDTPMQAAMKNAAERYLAEEAPVWFACCGQSGAGKTHLCTAIFTRLVADRGLEGEYMVWGPALRRIRTEIYQGGEALLDRYRRAKLLYIDDLFKGETDRPINDTDLRLAFELIDYRYNNRLRTILSTERTLRQLVALDQAVAGRIRERCGSYLLNIDPSGEKNFRFRS